MKIQHISFGNNGSGAYNAAYRLHESLKSKIYSSMLVVFNSYPEDKSIVTPNKRFFYFIGMKQKIVNLVKYLILPKKYGPYSFSFFNSSLLKEINNSNADIIHLHWINFEMLSISDIAKINKPIIWTVHDMWPFSGLTHLNIQLDKNLNRLLIFNFINKLMIYYKIIKWKHKNFHIVVPSNWMLNKIKFSSIMKNYNISVIPNPIDTNFWKPELLNKSAIVLNENILIKIGFGAYGFKNDTNKGYNLFLEALIKLKKLYKVSNFEIFTFGDEFPDEIHNEGYKINHIGKELDKFQMRSFYNSIDVLIVPSIIESFGQVATESASCGTPVIGFDSSGLNDIILHEVTGFLAKSYNTDDIVNGISWFINNHNEGFSLAQNCRKYAVQRFSYEVISENFVNLYKHLVK